MSSAFHLFVMCSLAAGLAAQDTGTVSYSQNSISDLLAVKAPQLRDEYASAGDLWMLTDRRFDLLSNGAQQFLLKKYGYIDFVPDGPENARAQAVPKALRTASNAPAPGVNIPVSQAFFRVGRRLQSETTLAVNGANIVVGFNDGDLRGQAVAFSRDSGATWSGGRLPSFPGVTSGNAGDPVLAIGLGGRVYHAYLAPTGIGNLAVALAWSDDGGATWTGPVNATASLGASSNFLDKPWMAVDNTPGSPFLGNIYVTCGVYTINSQNSIQLIRSVDGGKTFSKAVALSTLSLSDAAAFQIVQGSFIAIGPGGEVYVCWYDSRFDGIRVVTSTDGGVTFSNPVTALSGIGFAGSYYVPGTFEVADFGQLAVDTSSGPNRGAVYVTTNVLNLANYDLDIMLAHSGDGGASWDAPVLVNNDRTGTSQFQPAVAVAANGNVGVSFYDRRNDPNDVLTDVYLAISSDGGKTFPIQQRVTTESWLILPTPIGYRAGYHGDYNGIVASGGNFYLSWGDDRDGTDPSVYTATIPASGGLPDFTLSATNPSADILAGDTASFNLLASASGVKLSATVFPATGITVQANGNNVTAASTAATAPGTYTITVTGDTGAIQRSTELRLTVHSSDLQRVPTAITSTADPSYNSQSAIDSQGNLHVVYAGSLIARMPKRITYMQIPPNGVPLPAVTLYLTDLHSPAETVQDPFVGLSSNGAIYVVWRHSDAASDAIVLTVSTDNGKTFSSPVDISTQTAVISGRPTQVHGFKPRIGIGKNGAVFVSFQRQNVATNVQGLPPGVFQTVRSDIAVIHSTDGGATFSDVAAPVRYAVGSSGAGLTTASPPALALDSGDNPYVVWLSGFGIQGMDIYLARSRDGGATFDVAVNASGYQSGNVTPRYPAITIDPQDSVYVAWSIVDGNTGLGDNILAVSTDGVKFAIVNNLSNATYYSGAITDWPTIKADSSGGLVAVWREWVNAPYRLNDTERDVFFTRCSSLGSSCTTPVNVSSSLGDTLLSAGSGQVQPPSLAVDASGRIYILYDDDTAGSPQVMLWTSPASSISSLPAGTGGK